MIIIIIIVIIIIMIVIIIIMIIKKFSGTMDFKQIYNNRVCIIVWLYL